MSINSDLHPPTGAVELREDAPLRSRGARLCGGGPRLVLGAFAALSVAVTVALLTQIHYGDYQVVPHGAVSCSAATCAAAGAAALRRGGRAADATVAAALCLAVLAPHRTSLDASGALLYWEYRSSRSQPPAAAEWGGAGGAGERPPRLLVALAALHQRYGALPWADALAPAVQLARGGFPVSAGLAAAAAAHGAPGYATVAARIEPALADYLEALQRNTSSELCAAWQCAGAVRWSSAAPVAAGAWRVWSAGAGGALGAAALRDALGAGKGSGAADAVLERVVSGLKQRAASEPWPGGVASGLAAVDAQDTYAALVTGLSTPFGSSASSTNSSVNSTADSSSSAWTRDEPTTPLSLAPAIVADQSVCGTRYVVGAESAAALAQGAAALLAADAGAADAAVAAAERARTLVGARGVLQAEAGAAPPLPALNFVRQRGDALLSHADSRGGGVASRF